MYKFIKTGKFYGHLKCLRVNPGLQLSRHVTRFFCTSRPVTSELLKHLTSRIRMNGPITVAEYMREVLTNPIAGYYMHRDVFGEKGDFITSPEISQMFGELIGVWCVNEWQQCGCPDQLQLVELGPGRGTLTDDILRVFSKFKDIQQAVSVHLVEVSPKLSQIQAEKLVGRPIRDSPADTSVTHGHYQTCHSKYGPNVYWYSQLPDVPRQFSFFIAHEFFDALPIHKFQKQDGKWCEVLVDVQEDAGSQTLRYVLSRGETAATKLLLEEALRPGDTRMHMEVCPEGAVLAQELANRVAIDGGFAMIADYGHEGNKSDTFRGFKNHKLHDVLTDPGSADLTADVDFAYFKTMIDDRASIYGPVTQDSFLHSMGIGVRLKVLLANADTEQRKNLITGYDMLTNPDKMGERFKFMALLRHRPADYIPAGFTLLNPS